jgi:hypothetical protein
VLSERRNALTTPAMATCRLLEIFAEQSCDQKPVNGRIGINAYLHIMHLEDIN